MHVPLVWQYALTTAPPPPKKLLQNNQFNNNSLEQMWRMRYKLQRQRGFLRIREFDSHKEEDIGVFGLQLFPKLGQRSRCQGPWAFSCPVDKLTRSLGPVDKLTGSLGIPLPCGQSQTLLLTRPFYSTYFHVSHTPSSCPTFPLDNAV